MAQLRKVSRDRKGNIRVLKILVSGRQRIEADEKVIRKRLGNFFYDNYQSLLEEMLKIRKKGVLFCLAGLLFMSCASYIYYLRLPHFYPNLLLVLFEPAGWFLLWNGLDDLLAGPKSKKTDLNFYSRIADAHVEFASY